MENKRRNYIDFGFSLDKSYNFSFLPEEINANAFLKPDKNKKMHVVFRIPMLLII